MKLLIVTQKVDFGDSNLGFFHSWISEFSKYCEQVIVICLQEGEHNLPANVTVKSLGKERGTGKLTQVLRFAFCVLRSDYEVVLVHMNPEYLVLAGWWWRFLGKKIALWYTHKHVDLKLRVAEKFANIIFTASTESLRLKSKKVLVTGHGIDTDFFSPGAKHFRDSQGGKVLTVGRITRSKNLEEIIKAVGPGCELAIAGAPITESDREYQRSLESKANFIGPVAYQDLPDLYRSADLFVNASTTGSIDKAVLEALACNVPVVTTNEAFKQVAHIYVEISDLRKTITTTLELEHYQPSLRSWVIKSHSLKNLIPQIVQNLDKC